MLPETPRISSRPARDIRSSAGGVVFLQAEAELGLRDLLERPARRFLVLDVDLRLRASVELAGPLGRQDDQEITVRHLLQRLFQRRERHWRGTSMSGSLSVRRLVRQRSAWMIVASWSTASFTSRLIIR